jgi:hypothetical protein
MITTATPNLGAMPQQRLFPRRLRLIPPLETYPTVLSFVQTGLGKLVLLAVFGAGLRYTSRYWLPILFLLTVFCILHVFDYVNRTYPLSEHLRFFAHLFNLAS